MFCIVVQIPLAHPTLYIMIMNVYVETDWSCEDHDDLCPNEQSFVRLDLGHFSVYKVGLGSQRFCSLVG